MPVRLPAAVLWAALTLTALTVGSAEAVPDAITYTVEPRPRENYFQVTMDIPNVRGMTLRLELPNWTPGVYGLGGNSENIVDFAAEDRSRKSLPTFHPAPNRWEISTNGAKFVHVRYRVKSTGLVPVNGVPKRCHINGPRTYLYVVGRQTESVVLSLIPPTGARVWKVATSLDPIPMGEPDVGLERIESPIIRTFTAPNYDVLTDSPIEMGDYAEESFVVRGKSHHIVLYGDYETLDRIKLRKDCQRVTEIVTDFFGDAPYTRYIFMFRVVSGDSGAGGGLEHLNSMEIRIPRSGDQRIEVGAVGILHEFFHLWNVKRIRPLVLGPFDYQRPQPTVNLWWCEGVTDYYSYLLSRRGEIISEADYLRHLTETITALQNTPARLQVSADESSLRIWEVNNNQGYGISYYTKGCLVGLCLDLKLRQVTRGRRSLDDVMRALYVQCGRGNGPGFDEDDIKATINRVAGKDLSAFYDLVARSTEELPLAECLGYAGMNIHPSEETVADPGMLVVPDSDFKALTIQECTPNGAAAKADLKVGDRVVAVNGETDMRQAVERMRSSPGTAFILTVERDGSRKEVTYVIGARRRTLWKVSVKADATPDQIHFRQQWLSGTPR